ncbi:MAG TPA: transglutaminase family protein [Acidimicrobiales bacterium]|nr:transglutaminase family protein [Acidimicrobiales bacterium]
MSWRIATRHTSTYRYGAPVVASYNEARITPQERDGQRVLESAVAVHPQTALYHYRDYFGSAVVAFDIPEPHDQLVVIGTSTVETASARPLPAALTWEGLASLAEGERFIEYLRPTPFTTGDDELLAVAKGFRVAASPSEAVEGASGWIRAEMTYELGATAVSTSALEAWHARRGVCQDFAHIGLVLLRSLGIPARYVSGYLHPSREAEIGTTVAGAGHAWIECWLGDWLPIDPTHGEAVGDRHVTVARGRDYADVAPFRGVYQGGALESLDVSVELVRMA